LIAQSRMRPLKKKPQVDVRTTLPPTPTLALRLSAHHPPPISAGREVGRVLCGTPAPLRMPAMAGMRAVRARTSLLSTANHRSAKPTPQRDGWTAICDFPAHLPNVVGELRNSLLVGPVGWLTRLHNRVSCETWVAAFTAPGVSRDRLSNTYNFTNESNCHASECRRVSEAGRGWSAR
jgi:hypothetical protein